jgi:hypothetical protein
MTGGQGMSEAKTIWYALAACAYASGLAAAFFGGLAGQSFENGNGLGIWAPLAIIAATAACHLGALTERARPKDEKAPREE